MARRLTALLALVVIVALALTLLWRVWGHHMKSEHVDDETAIVDVRLSVESAEKFARSRT